MGCSKKEQVADKTYKILLEKSTFTKDDGPIIFIDEAHYNFHTANNRYYKFSELLRLDGYVVKPSDSLFTESVLSSCDILVISNALNKNNFGEDNWHLPTPSAFTKTEKNIIVEWVSNGGSLLLIDVLL